MAPEIFAQVHVLDVFDDANDRHVRYTIEPDVLSDHIRRAEIFLRQFLVDDEDLRRTDAIVVVEVATGNEGNFERLEVIVGNRRDVSPHALAFARRITVDDDRVLIPAAGNRRVGSEAPGHPPGPRRRLSSKTILK